MMTAVLLLLTVLCFVKVQGQVTTEWTVAEFPNPVTSPVECGGFEGQYTFICDPNNIIPESYKELNHLLNSTYFETKCPCSAYKCGDLNYKRGTHISVAIVANLRLTSGRTDPLQEAENFASELENRKWNFGECDNDVVILYSVGDEVVWTMVGSTSREVLNEGKIREITANSGKYFLDRDIGSGLFSMIVQYRSVLSGTSVPYSEVDQTLRGSAMQRTLATSCFFAILFSTILAFL